MGKRILKTLGWAAVLFAIMGLIQCFAGVDMKLEWILPFAVGYFTGYGDSEEKV